MNMTDKLRSLADEISAGATPPTVQGHWALIGRLIGRTPADQAEAARVVQEQDIAALHALLDVLQGKVAAPKDDTPQGADDATPEIGTDDLNAAMRAFKKRLKLARLNDESRLGSKQLSGGKSSEIDAIIAPTEYPHEVWQALAKQGRLVDTGGGFYGLPR